MHYKTTDYKVNWTKNTKDYPNNAFASICFMVCFYIYQENNLKMQKKEINRKEALLKIKSYGKYAALTALGTYILLQPQKAQASSPEAPGTGF
jgi:hypothetical protein